MDSCCGFIGTIVLLAVVFLVGCGSYIVAFARVHRVGIVIPVTQCSSCGYSLDGLKLGGTCPECGKATPNVRYKKQRRLEYESGRVWMFLLCAASCFGAYFILHGTWSLVELWLGVGQFHSRRQIPPLFILAWLYAVYIGFGWIAIARVPLQTAARHSMWFGITVIAGAVVAPIIIHRAGGDATDEAAAVGLMSTAVAILAVCLALKHKPERVPIVPDDGQ